MKKILILGASELQLPAIVKAKEMGLFTIVADYNEKAIGVEFADKFYKESTLDFDKIFEISKKESIDGIMTICSDRPMPIIAKIGNILNLNTITYDAALKATNKAMMRQALEKEKVAIPRFYICKNKEDYYKAVNDLGLPVIVKPSDNSGSRGIYLLDDKKNIQQGYEHSMDNSSNGLILVEEYMIGNEVSVEAFVIEKKCRIIQVTDKITSGPPFFVELGHTQPSIYCESKELKDIVKKSVNALNIDSGPVHVEVMFTDSGPKIVELGARLGGDHITTDLVPLSTGIDIVKMTIENAIGDNISRYEKANRCSCIRYIENNCDKYIRMFKSLKLKSLISYHIYPDVKKKVIESSNDRLGYFILSSDKMSEINNDLNKVENFLKEIG